MLAVHPLRNEGGRAKRGGMLLRHGTIPSSRFARVRFAPPFASEVGGKAGHFHVGKK